MKMNFEEFKERIVNDIKNYLPAEYETAEVTVSQVLKNNHFVRTGLNIRTAEVNISPTVYLEPFFEEYLNNDKTMTTILEDIARMRVEHNLEEDFNIEQFLEFSNIEGCIFPRLINKELNKEMLEDLPHTDVADLTAIYMIVKDDFFGGAGSVKISYRMMEGYGLSVEDLHMIAMQNLKRSKHCFQDIMTVLMGLLNEEISEDKPDTGLPMYVLTNESKTYGAALILDNDYMEQIENQFGKFYIIPSSVHEVIIIPAEGEIETYTEMIREINETQVALSDRLSNELYSWDAENGIQAISAVPSCV